MVTSTSGPPIIAEINSEMADISQNSHSHSAGGGYWRSFFVRESIPSQPDSEEEDKGLPSRWSMGVLNDTLTHEVPGSVLLLTGQRNEPLGMGNAPARTSTSSVPSSVLRVRRVPSHSNKKKTPDGTIILEPQPDDSHNDPLNWPAWRRDCALLSLGLYCMVGGGMTPILAAGFTNVASDFDVTASQVALTTGLYMLGLGVGSVFALPTAILYGKRPVYLGGCILFIGTCIWCALSPSYGSLVGARVLQGIALSPVECLPSATIAEIFFLHERAFRIGIYTLLLLGGKNLVPLVSAAIIQSLSWRWVFWIVAMVAGFCFILLFFFVPETFWDRAPKPKSRDKSRKSSIFNMSTWTLKRVAARTDNSNGKDRQPGGTDGSADDGDLRRLAAANSVMNPKASRTKAERHVDFVHRSGSNAGSENQTVVNDEQVSVAVDALIERSEGSGLQPLNLTDPASSPSVNTRSTRRADAPRMTPGHLDQDHSISPRHSISPARHKFEDRIQPRGLAPPTPGLHNFNSPFYSRMERSDSDYMSRGRPSHESHRSQHDGGRSIPNDTDKDDGPLQRQPLSEAPTVKLERPGMPPRYTTYLRDSPKQTFTQQLKPFNGRLHMDNWFRVAVRPFILFSYPAVLWSSVIYACSVGWLIVLSESVAEVYRNKETYNFSALSTGLVYISPFVGGILGTAVAGKVSDIIVKFMSRRNGGLYEPEFRLVMAVPIAITTVIGLMGFGWSVTERDAWIVPTIFFGIISFGCSLGSTTAITFCVDSYRQYAGEALVTLNFSKNVLHGLVFSLFFNSWLAADGAKSVFLAIGGIQLALLLFTIPMYVFGKRARMWTTRNNLMERF